MATHSPSQAGLPRGLLGRILGRLMTWHNAPDYKYTLQVLQPGTGDHVLEVGFGSGASVEFLAKANPSVQIAGIDHSEEMLGMARARNRDAIQIGRMDLRVGSVMELPYDNGQFDKAFSINCIYFWDDPVRGLKELYRVLKPGGALAVTVRDKSRPAYRPFQPDKLMEMFSTAGFENIQVLNNGVANHSLNCALGTR
jgi:ubiquinone/menaquinone biosynthesis C-methylase UbiE